MSKRGSKVWYNGKILPAEQAQISLFTHGLHYGTGAFEGIRAYKQKSGGGAVFRLAEHVDRLIDSAKILEFNIPYNHKQILTACLEICKANQFDECYIRPIFYVADGPLGVFPGLTPPIDLAILTWEWGKYLGDKSAQLGARMKISSYNRPHVNSLMTKAKATGQYLTGVLAKKEAIQLGYDEALMLDPEGFLTEATGANLFIIKDRIVKTTPLGSLLAGITRDTLVTMIRARGLTLVEQRFTRDELYCADEVFVTGTAAEVTPVREIDGRAIGRGDHAGKPGPITVQLSSDYQQIVHGELVTEFSKNWLSKI